MSAQTVSGTLWSDQEYRESLAAYAQMLKAERRGAPMVKRDVVNKLMNQTGRSRASVERRFQNISAVLNELGRPWIDGYKPLGHYPRRLRELVEQAVAQGAI